MTEVSQFPWVRQAIMVAVVSPWNKIGSDDSGRIAEADPPAVGAVSVAAELACLRLDFRRANAFEIDPTDVCSISVAAQTSERISVHAEIAAAVVLILDAIGRTTAAEIDPAHVGGVDEAGADVFANDRAVIRIAAPIDPTDVRAVSVFVCGIDGG